MCRSNRFFAYNKEVEAESNFQSFKPKLESSVAQVDLNHKIMTYTPHAAAAAYAIVGIIGTAVGGPVSLVFHILHIAIPVISTATYTMSHLAKNNAVEQAQKLITEGEQLNYFALTPELDVKDPESAEKGKHLLNNDAMRYRLLGV